MADPDSRIVSKLLFLLALVAVSAFFSMSEIAIISLNDNKIKKMAQEGNKKAGVIAKLIAEPSRFLATIQVGGTLSGFWAAAVAADAFAGQIVQAFAKFPVPAPTLYGAAVFLIIVLLSYISLVFGELVPKRVAMQNYEKISFAVAGILAFISSIAKPFVALLSASTNGILRLIGVDPHHMPEEVTEEEIRMMIDVGGESGTIEQSEKDMLNNIFEFDDSTVVEMMTHRTDLTAVELGTPLEDVIAIAVASGHSRIPVYEEDLDSIVGVLYVKDLLSLVSAQATEGFDLKDYMREPLYVLETTKSALMLREFQTKKIQVAIVIDEYGGTSGLVSMEDLLEQIVGNIQDEYDDEDEEITHVGDNQYLVDGLAPLDNVLKFFSAELKEADEYDTIGGYVTSELGYIPGEDEHPKVVLDCLRLTVSKMEDRRVSKLFVEYEQAQSGDCPDPTEK